MVIVRMIFTGRLDAGDWGGREDKRRYSAVCSSTPSCSQVINDIRRAGSIDRHFFAKGGAGFVRSTRPDGRGRRDIVMLLGRTAVIVGAENVLRAVKWEKR